MLALIAIGGTFFLAKNERSAPTVSAENATSTTAKLFTLEDITKHADAKSCYTTIQGEVYDLTSWINVHPGGAQNILSICGKDGTSAFVAQHGGKQKQADILKTFLIGELKT